MRRSRQFAEIVLEVRLPLAAIIVIVAVEPFDLPAAPFFIVRIVPVRAGARPCEAGPAIAVAIPFRVPILEAAAARTPIVAGERTIIALTLVAEPAVRSARRRGPSPAGGPARRSATAAGGLPDPGRRSRPNSRPRSRSSSPNQERNSSPMRSKKPRSSPLAAEVAVTVVAAVPASRAAVLGEFRASLAPAPFAIVAVVSH